MSWGLIFLSGLKCPSHADHFSWGKQLQRCSGFKETLWYWHDPCNDSSWTIPTFFLLQYSSYRRQNLILNTQSLVLFSTMLFRLLIISFLPVISYLITPFLELVPGVTVLRVRVWILKPPVLFAHICAIWYTLLTKG